MMRDRVAEAEARPEEPASQTRAPASARLDLRL
jgi:hypothetical protein